MYLKIQYDAIKITIPIIAKDQDGKSLSPSDVDKLSASGSEAIVPDDSSIFLVELRQQVSKVRVPFEQEHSSDIDLDFRI